jgi:hypothetical protein
MASLSHSLFLHHFPSDILRDIFYLTEDNSSNSHKCHLLSLVNKSLLRIYNNDYFVSYLTRKYCFVDFSNIIKSNDEWYNFTWKQIYKSEVSGKIVPCI